MISVDFNKVADHLGGDGALDSSYVRQPTERGMKLMLDITPNHIGFHHEWFTSAQENPDNDTAEFFFRHPDTGEFEYWLGVSSLVKLNYTSQKLRDEMYGKPDSPIRYWLKPPFSIDGWRLDVANMTGNYWQYQLDAEVWREMRQAIKEENPSAYMMGEFFQDSSPIYRVMG